MLDIKNSTYHSLFVNLFYLDWALNNYYFVNYKRR
jgi:hypothetical protein